MKIFDTKVFLLTMSALMIFCVSSAYACGCGGSDIPSTPRQIVNGALRLSTSVFTGKVVAFEYRKGIRNEFMESQRDAAGQPIKYETKVVKFEVDRWWKLKLPPIVYIITNGTKNSDNSVSVSGCDFVFELGEKYLVYADGKPDSLQAHQCTRTTTVDNASADLEILGEGFRPVERVEHR